MATPVPVPVFSRRLFRNYGRIPVPDIKNITDGIMSGVDTKPVAAQPIQVGYQPTARSSPEDYSVDMNYGAQTRPPVIAPEEDVLESEPATSEELDAIKRASDEALEVAVINRQVSKEEALAAATLGQDQVGALLSEDEPETDEEFLAQYAKALGIDGLQNKDYNAKAKAMLGIDPDEADVPTWAAPMFMFGLKLMKGPVTGKTEGRSLLGGFLGDVGVAGEEAFPLIAVERARKRKQKAAVGQMAYQLEQSDKSAWANLLKVQREDERWYLEFGQKEAIRMDGLLDSTIKLYTQGENAEAVAKFSTAFNTAIEGLVPGKNADGTQISSADQSSFRARLLSNPSIRNLIAARASADAGITTGMDLETISVGMGEVTIDKTRLAKIAQNLGKPEGEILQTALNAHNNGTIKHPGVIIAESVDPSTIEMKTIEIGDGLQQRVIVDKSQFGVKDYEPTNLGPAFDPKRPELKEVKYKDSSGIERIILYDPAKLRTAGITLNEAILNKRADIISGNMTNFTGNVSDIPIYVDGRKGRAIFDENAFQAWKAESDDRSKVNYSDKEYFDEFQKLGIIRVLPGTISSGEMTTVSQIGTDGTVTMITAPADRADQVMSELNDKTTRRAYQGQLSSTISLHRVAFELQNIIQRSLIPPELVVSGVAGLWSGVASLIRQAEIITKGQATKSLANFNNTGFLHSLGNREGRSAEMRAEINAAFNEDIMFSGNSIFAGIKAGADRQALRSYLIETAFALASAREGGKLTDNDVKYAFETLGYKDGSWTQTPEQLMAGLRSATNNQTESFVSRFSGSMSDKLIARGDDRGIFEHLLASDLRLKGTAGRENSALGRYWNQQVLRDENKKIILDEQGFPRFKKGTLFRFDSRQLQRPTVEREGEPPFIPVETSFLSGITAEMDTGTFTGHLRTTRIPNSFMVLHKEVFTPGGVYKVIDSPVDFMTRLKVAAQRLKKLNPNLTDQQITEQVNAYKNFLVEQQLFIKAGE